MRQFSSLILTAFLCFFFRQHAFAQVENCGANSPKISFSGKAPAPWAIDGSTADWQTISGSPFNRWMEQYDDGAENYPDDPFEDHPTPEQDVHFLSFVHDDYNVYFYFSRYANGTASNSFYYFLDVNADGYMDDGEPVFHAAFTNNQISSSTLSRYIANRNIPPRDVYGEPYTQYLPGKGNPLGTAFGIGFGAVTVAGYPSPGTLQKIFSAGDIPAKEHLKKNEVFAAALTENGYGVELAVPWRYLRYWLPKERGQGHSRHEDKKGGVKAEKWENTKPLKPGDIFFYKLSLKQGSGAYAATEVKDNAGNCCGGLARSGNVAYTKELTTTVLVPHQKYRYTLDYTNLTNASVVFAVTEVGFQNIQFYNPATATNEGIKIKLYVDRNCNRRIDPDEPAVDDFARDEFEGEFDFASSPQHDNIATAPPYGKVCYIVEVTLPPNLIKTADVVISPELIDFTPVDICDTGAGGRTINTVGSATGSIYKTLQQKDPLAADKPISEVIVYPNPSNGSTRVLLPTNGGAVNIALQDLLGRNMQNWKDCASASLQLNGLKAGIYVLKVQYIKSGKVETRKIVVQ